jgi:hypothetical protein
VIYPKDGERERKQNSPDGGNSSHFSFVNFTLNKKSAANVYS